MIEVNKKQDCCGCTACAAICPKDAIIMKEDNEGFLYPTVDKETCINCGACEKVCPIKYPIRQQKRKDDIYYIQCKDENIRSQSTSGGMFTALAEFVIKKEVLFLAVHFKMRVVIGLSIRWQKIWKIFMNSEAASMYKAM